MFSSITVHKIVRYIVYICAIHCLLIYIKWQRINLHAYSILYFYFILWDRVFEMGSKRGEREGTEQRTRACGDHKGDEFLLATISAPGFPLVYPEVNNWCEDKSVCEGEWDIQTREWKPGYSPLYRAPLSARAWPLAVWWPLTPPHRTSAWSANLCSDLFLVAVSMFSSCQWRLTGGLSHPCAGTVAGSLTGQWHCPTR